MYVSGGRKPKTLRKLESCAYAVSKIMGSQGLIGTRGNSSRNSTLEVKVAVDGGLSSSSETGEYDGPRREMGLADSSGERVRGGGGKRGGGQNRGVCADVSSSRAKRFLSRLFRRFRARFTDALDECRFGDKSFRGLTKSYREVLLLRFGIISGRLSVRRKGWRLALIEVTELERSRLG